MTDWQRYAQGHEPDRTPPEVRQLIRQLVAALKALDEWHGGEDRPSEIHGAVIDALAAARKAGFE